MQAAQRAGAERIRGQAVPGVCAQVRQAPHARRELLQVRVLVVLAQAVKLLGPLDRLLANATIVLGLPSLLGLSFVGLAGAWVGGGGWLTCRGQGDAVLAAKATP